MRDERIEAGLCFFLLGRVRPGSRWLQLKVAIHIAFVKEARDIGAPYFGSGFGFGFFSDLPPRASHRSRVVPSSQGEWSNRARDKTMPDSTKLGSIRALPWRSSPQVFKQVLLV